MGTAIIIIFIIGYILIAFEHPIKINKSATAILTGVLCWAIYAFSGESSKRLHMSWPNILAKSRQFYSSYWAQ